MRRLIVATVVALVCTVALAGNNAQAASACSSNDLELVRLMNVKRAEQTAVDGIARRPLVTTEALCQAADVRRGELAIKFSHYRPDGSWFGSIFTQFGITYRHAAEFIHYISYSPQHTFNKWWPTSRRVEILRPGNRYAGAACCGYAVALLVKP